MEIVRAREISECEIDQVNELVKKLSSGAKLLSTEEMNTLLSDDNLVLFIACVDGKIVGMLSLVFYQIPTGLRARIEDVVVLDEYRGLGIARSMSEKAILTFKKSGARTLDLTSSPSRIAANKLYQSIGFVRRETNVYRFYDP
ncbi:MAG: GNAT family N-acetyltransferase [Pseudomonadota bacterium]